MPLILDEKLIQAIKNLKNSLAKKNSPAAFQAIDAINEFFRDISPYTKNQLVNELSELKNLPKILSNEEVEQIELLIEQLNQSRKNTDFIATAEAFFGTPSPKTTAEQAPDRPVRPPALSRQECEELSNRVFLYMKDGESSLRRGGISPTTFSDYVLRAEANNQLIDAETFPITTAVIDGNTDNGTLSEVVTNAAALLPLEATPEQQGRARELLTIFLKASPSFNDSFFFNVTENIASPPLDLTEAQQDQARDFLTLLLEASTDAKHFLSRQDGLAHLIPKEDQTIEDRISIQLWNSISSLRETYPELPEAFITQSFIAIAARNPSSENLTRLLGREVQEDNLTEDFVTNEVPATREAYENLSFIKNIVAQVLICTSLSQTNPKEISDTIKALWSGQKWAVNKPVDFVKQLRDFADQLQEIVTRNQDKHSSPQRGTLGLFTSSVPSQLDRVMMDQIENLRNLANDIEDEVTPSEQVNSAPAGGGGRRP